LTPTAEAADAGDSNSYSSSSSGKNQVKSAVHVQQDTIQPVASWAIF
jgi:hypothetical protein